MNSAKAHRALLLANIPVGLFAVVAAWAALFGVGDWDWVRGLWVMGPIILAAWLAYSTYLLESGRHRLAIALVAMPVAGLTAVLAFIWAIAS